MSLKECRIGGKAPKINDKNQRSQGKINVLNNIDCVPSNVQSSRQEDCCMCLRIMKQKMFFCEKNPAKNPIGGIGPPSFCKNFQWMAVIARSRDFDSPLTAFDSRGSRPSGPLRRSMGKIQAGLGFVEKHAFWVRFFLCSLKRLGLKSSCRCSHVPVDLPYLTSLDVTLALTFPDVSKISKLWWGKEVWRMTCCKWWWVHVFFFFFSFLHQLKSRLRTTSNQMCNGKLVQWYCAYGMMMTNLGQDLICFSVLT